MTTSDPPHGYLRVLDVAARIERTERTAWARIARAGVPRFRDASGRTVIRECDLVKLDAPVPIPRADAD